MEDHVQEFSYTMVVNAHAEEAPAVLINRVPYALAIRAREDLKSVLRAYRTDARFNANCTRVKNKVALKQAVEAGVIFFRARTDGVLTWKEEIPPQFMISATDTESDKLLWARAHSNIKPGAGREMMTVPRPHLSTWWREKIGA
eukprot:s3403_g7.t1